MKIAFFNLDDNEKRIININFINSQLKFFDNSINQTDIEEFCDSIAILNNGVVALHGDLHDIKRDYPRDRLVVKTETPDAIKADFDSSCTVMDNGDLMIRLGSPSVKKATMTRLVENYDIDEVKVYEPSLNDIFVEYAGDAAQED